jgi:hypothetical protein
MKDKLLHLIIYTAKKQRTMPTGPLWISEEWNSSCGCATEAYLLKDLKTAGFERGPEPEKALQRVQNAIQASVPFGPKNPIDDIMYQV